MLGGTGVCDGERDSERVELGRELGPPRSVGVEGITHGANSAERSSPALASLLPQASGVVMSFPVGGELYPGRSLSIPQLVHATKMKLPDSTSGGR